MRVQDVMVRNVVTIDASAMLVEAAKKMREANVGVLPVIEDGQMRGVLTDRDLVVRAIAREADPASTSVGDCATTELLTAQPDWDVDEALKLMAHHQIGRLPVVDDEHRPIGIVTLSSVALRSREDDETLTAAKEVSRRSAKGAPRPAGAVARRAKRGAEEARPAKRPAKRRKAA